MPIFKHAIDALPQEIRGEYLSQEASLFHTRVSLYCTITTGIYFAVSLQYLFRKTVLLMDTFRPWELSLWGVLLFGTVLCYVLNRQSQSRGESKRIALLYTGFFVWSFSGLAVVYPENNLVFVFYYAFALLFTSVLIPWSIPEILWLTALYAGAFLVEYDYVVFMMRYPLPSMPRFMLPWDGLVFIAISSFISVAVRRKEMERDVHNFLLLKRIEKQNVQMDRELDLARRVHRTLVPVSFSTDRADVWVSYVPMSYVSGDYAKVRFLDENKLLVFISDVTGHGVAAALLVNRLHTEFERLSRGVPEPAQLLKKLNEFISKDFEGTEMYLSAFCGLLDFEKGEFRYCNSGHPAQFWYHGRTKEIRELSSHETLLGVSSGRTGNYSQGGFEFETGDRLLLFTDGVIEAADRAGVEYGDARLKEYLRQNHSVPDERFNQKLIEDLARHRGGGFSDDIFILNIRAKVVSGAAPKASGVYDHAEKI